MENELTPTQQAIVDATDRNIIVSAAAGSGKTRVLTTRICPRFKEGHTDPMALPGAIVITYTNEAAAMLKRRLQHAPRFIRFIGTIHAFAKYVIQCSSGRLISVLTEDESVEAIKSMSASNMMKVPIGVIRKIAAGRSIDDKPEFKLLERIWKQKQRADRRYSFAELVSEATETMKAVQLPRGFFSDDVLFVDEFQDVTPETVAFLESLDVMGRFFVGDPNQSIYGFIGGDPSHMIRIAGGPADEVDPLKVFTHYKMEETFRCDRTITLIANFIIRTLPSTGFQIRSMRPDDGKGDVGFHQSETTGEEIALNLGRINPNKTGISYNDTAVICRTNALCDAVESVAKGLGIPIKKRAVRRQWHPAIAALLSGIVYRYEEWAQREVAKLVLGETAAQAGYLEALSEGRSYVWRPNMENLNGVEEVIDYAARVEFSHQDKPSAEEWEAVRKLCRDHLVDQAIDLLFLLKSGRHTEEIDDGEGLTICTIHAAKGLEWEQVWMPGLCDAYWRGAPDETRRLLYVGITRAKRIALLTWSLMATVQNFGAKEPKPTDPILPIQELIDNMILTFDTYE